MLRRAWDPALGEITLTCQHSRERRGGGIPALTFSCSFVFLRLRTGRLRKRRRSGEKKKGIRGLREGNEQKESARSVSSLPSLPGTPQSSAPSCAFPIILCICPLSVPPAASELLKRQSMVTLTLSGDGRASFSTKVPYSLFTTSKAEVSRNDLGLFTEDRLYLVPGFILSTRSSVVPCMERCAGLSRSLSGPFSGACWERSKFAFSNNRRRVLKSSKQLPEGGREVTNTGCTVTVEK